MKLLKKLMIVFVAVLMVMSLTSKLYAEETGGTSETTATVTPATDKTTETDGSVEVTNTKKDQKYTLYKLFDADMGVNNAITYTLPAGKTEADLTYNEKSWFELNSNGFVVAKSGTVDEWAKDPDAKAWAVSFGSKVGDEKTAASDGDTNVKWDTLAYGYYYVDTTLGSFIGVDSANKNAEIAEKNEVPSVDKEIVSTTSGAVGDDPTKAEDTAGDKGKNEAATAQVGDTITYKVTVSAKPGAENYVVTDTLSNGLTAPSAEAVTVTGLNKGTDKDYTVTVEGQTITVTFTKTFLDSITADRNLVINYTAVLNENAVIGSEGNPNTVTLKWGHKTVPDSSTDDAKVYTAKISLTKKDDKNNGLAGAEFALKNSDGKYYALDQDGKVTWVDAVASATKYTSGSDGKLSGEFTGLSNGQYTLEETVVPAGYNPIDSNDASLKITIAADDYTDENLIQSTEVVNKAGAVLPSTGGIGTTIFHIAGAALVLGAGILLISKKRMNNN